MNQFNPKSIWQRNPQGLEETALMLTFLERTPEYEPLRFKFEQKLALFFSWSAKRGKTASFGSASSFSSKSPPSTPRSNVLVKIKNLFWLRLARKYAHKGLAHFIETLANKVLLKGLPPDPELEKSLLKLQFDTRIHLDLGLLHKHCGGSVDVDVDVDIDVQSLYMLFITRSGVRKKFEEQARNALKKRTRDRDAAKNKDKENRRENYLKQKTEKVLNINPYYTLTETSPTPTERP